MSEFAILKLGRGSRFIRWEIFAPTIAVLTIVAANLHQLSRASSQESSPGLVEYRQLHPDARKLIVDEIRVQLQAESDAKWNIFWDKIARWAAIGSAGVGGLAAVLGIAGWRGLANMRRSIRSDVLTFVSTNSDFRRALDQKLADLVRDSTDTTSQRLKREIALARLELVARKVDESDSISHGDRMSMVEALVELGAAPDVSQTEAFKNAAYLVVKNFYDADIDNSIDELDDHLRKSFLKHTPIAQVLVGHYGERMLESEIPSQPLSARYLVYEEAIKSERRLDWMPFRFALLEREGTPEAKRSIEVICKSVKFMDEGDKKWIFGRLLAIVQTKENEIRTNRRALMVEAVRNFWTKNKSSIEAAYPPELIEEVSEELREDASAKPGE
jgi:hypothetical protein